MFTVAEGLTEPQALVSKGLQLGENRLLYFLRGRQKATRFEKAKPSEETNETFRCCNLKDELP